MPSIKKYKKTAGANTIEKRIVTITVPVIFKVSRKDSIIRGYNKIYRFLRSALDKQFTIITITPTGILKISQKMAKHFKTITDNYSVNQFII